MGPAVAREVAIGLKIDRRRPRSDLFRVRRVCDTGCRDYGGNFRWLIPGADVSCVTGSFLLADITKRLMDPKKDESGNSETAERS